MSETREIIICHCHEQSNHQSHSVSRNPNSRSVQRHSDDASASKIAAGIGGFLAGAAAVILLAAFLSDD